MIITSNMLSSTSVNSSLPFRDDDPAPSDVSLSSQDILLKLHQKAAARQKILSQHVATRHDDNDHLSSKNSDASVTLKVRKKMLPPETILKKLHAKARWRERNLLSNDSDVVAGNVKESTTTCGAKSNPVKLQTEKAIESVVPKKKKRKSLARAIGGSLSEDDNTIQMNLKDTKTSEQRDKIRPKRQIEISKAEICLEQPLPGKSTSLNLKKAPSPIPDSPRSEKKPLRNKPTPIPQGEDSTTTKTEKRKLKERVRPRKRSKIALGNEDDNEIHQSGKSISKMNNDSSRGCNIELDDVGDNASDTPNQPAHRVKGNSSSDKRKPRHSKAKFVSKNVDKSMDVDLKEENDSGNGRISAQDNVSIDDETRQDHNDKINDENGDIVDEQQKTQKRRRASKADDSDKSDGEIEGNHQDDDETVEDKQEGDGGKVHEVFTVLGGGYGIKKKKQMVARVLPDWLANPTLIEHDLHKDSIAVDKLEVLDPRLLKSLLDNGITRLFPVQRRVIPVILSSTVLGIHAGDAGYRPRDLCVSAPTGSGKTLAFAVPIVQALINRIVPRIRALVVLPTCDLAQQVSQVFSKLCRNTQLRATLIGGLKTFGREQRMLVTTSNSATQCDIVVATPGRLVDHINKSPGFSLQHLRFLVIDEADRMMDEISQDWIAQVEKCVYTGDRDTPAHITVKSCTTMTMPLQKLLFSATLSQNPEKLMQLNLFQPRLITSRVTSKRKRPQRAGGTGLAQGTGEFVGKFTTPAGLEEYYIECTPGQKPLIILHMIKTLNLQQILCFANTVEATNRLYHLIRLVGGVQVAEFSSNLSVAQRQGILRQFKAGKIQMMVCSDTMARGMDVENAKYVISYDMPRYIKTYIHRVGRTARAGKTGVAFSLLQKHEVCMLVKMLKYAGKTTIRRHTVDMQDVEYLVPSYEQALERLPSVVN